MQKFVLVCGAVAAVAVMVMTKPVCMGGSGNRVQCLDDDGGVPDVSAIGVRLAGVVFVTGALAVATRRRQ